MTFPPQFSPTALLPTQFHRAGASLLVGLGFLVASLAVYALGPRLKRRMTEEAAEATQAAAVTLSATAGGALLVLVWGAEGRVVAALDQALIDPTPDNGVKLLVTALALVLGYALTRVTKRFVNAGAGRDALTNHQREVLHHLVQIAVFVPVFLFVLGLWEFPVGNLLLAGGAIGIVAGLAARQTLGAMLAGFVLLFSRPFRIGDWIEVERAEGIVTDISIFNTRLRTFDDELVMIPNDRVTDSNVVNRSRSSRLRVSVDVGVDYAADVERAAAVAVEAMESLDEVADAPDPDVVLDRFGDSAVVLTLRFWIDEPSIRRKWAAQNAVIAGVKSTFEAEGITIPFPQRELAGREEAGGLRVATADGERDGAGRNGAETDDAGPDGVSADGRAGDGAASDGASAGDGGAPDADGADADDAETPLAEVSEPVEGPGDPHLEPAIRRIDEPGDRAAGDRDD